MGSQLAELQQQQRGLKTFDELCGEVYAELRGAGKSIDLCEKMKVFQSDLKRVQLLLMHSPRVVSKFVNSIGERYEGKSETEARQLFVFAKSLPITQYQRAIELLTSALRLSPWRKSEKKSQNEVKEFIMTQAADDNCIQWLVRMITATKLDSSSSTTKTRQDQNEEADHRPSPSSSYSSLSKKDENSSSSALLGRLQSDENNENDDDNGPGTDLLANIYFERCCRFHQQDRHESVVLDCARALICRSDKRRGKRKKLAFTTVSAVGASLKGMGHFPEAVLVLNHALQLLRRDNNYDNQAKSTETIKIVKALKDIQKIIPSPPTTATATLPNETKTQTKPLHVPKCPEPLQKKQQNNTDSNYSPPASQPREYKEELEQKEKEDKENGLPHVFGQTHPNLMAASDALDLVYNEHRGRHVVANRTIPPGATLIVDAPYSWSLCPPLYQTLCQHCCKKVVSGIPCQHCSSVVYCQWKCWQRSEHYHKFECAILKGLDSSEALGEMGLLCYRTVCRTSVRVLEYYASQVESDDKEINNKSTTTTTTTADDITSMANNSERSKEEQKKKKENLTLGLDLKTNKLDPANFSSVFALTTNAEQRPAGDIVKRTLAAIYLTLCLRYTGYFHHSSSFSSPCSTDTFNELQNQPTDTLSSCSLPKNDFDDHKEGNGEDFEEKLSHIEIQTAALILRLSQGLSCNAYGINSIVRHSRLGTSETQPLGGASYPTISIINHSCNPNVFRLTSGNTCIVRSILEIQKGEEIFDSYGPLFTTMPKSERKSLLKSQYFFNCDCEACEENWPLFKDLRTTQASRVNSVETSYKCPGCRKIVEEKEEESSGGGGNKKEKMRKSCSNCGHKFDLRKVTQSLAQSEKNYLAVKDSLLSTGRSSAAGESALAHHLTNLQKFITSPHKLIVECQETLKLAWNAALLDSQ